MDSYPKPENSVASRIFTKRRSAWFLIILCLAGLAYWLAKAETVTRIAFGSCSSTAVAQPIWQAVLAAEPDVWIWAGDNIYADSEDIKRQRRLYAQQNRHPLYTRLRRTAFVTGTWDDHDYGANNAGKEFPAKDESQQALLDFLQVPFDDPRRKQQGVYTSHTLGPEGKRLKIILLDTRYHRDPPSLEGDILGAAQWQWLQQELQDETTDLNLLVSSIAVIPRGPDFTEGWYRFPQANQRLSNAFMNSAAPIVLLTGDRHFAEISRFDHGGLEWPLYEVMSSGMTHSGLGFNYPNPYRIKSLYTGLNYGLIEIDWGQDAITVDMQVRDTDNKPRIRDRVVFPRHSE